MKHLHRRLQRNRWPQSGFIAPPIYRPFHSSSTADIEPADGLVGQQRAIDALAFGTRIGKPGFNLFVIGPNGMRAQRAVEQVLQEAAGERRSPSDWVYVNNFSDPRKPMAIELPAGRAGELRDAMHALIDDLKTTLPAVFESGRVEMWRGGCRLNISVSAPFVWRCLSGSAMTSFPHPAHRTGHADFPRPALGQDVTPSPTARRAQAQLGVRAQSAHKGARVDRSRPCVA